MADSKISGLSDGGSAQASDQIPINRSGTNYRISASNLAAAATSLGTLSSLTVSGAVTAGNSITVSGTNGYAVAVDGTIRTKIQSLSGGPSAYVGTESNHILRLIVNNDPKVDISTAGELKALYNFAVTGTSTLTGLVGLGANPQTTIGVTVGHTALTGTSQIGMSVEPSFTSAATSLGIGLRVQAATSSGSYTMADFRNLYITDAAKGGGGMVITTNYGLYIGAQTAGATNYAIYSAGGLNLFAGQAYFGSNVGGAYQVCVSVASGADADILQAAVTATSNGFQVKWKNSTAKIHVVIADIPTSSSGLPAGCLWNNSGVINIA